MEWFGLGCGRARGDGGREAVATGVMVVPKFRPCTLAHPKKHTMNTIMGTHSKTTTVKFLDLIALLHVTRPKSGHHHHLVVAVVAGWFVFGVSFWRVLKSSVWTLPS